MYLKGMKLLFVLCAEIKLKTEKFTQHGKKWQELINLKQWVECKNDENKSHFITMWKKEEEETTKKMKKCELWITFNLVNWSMTKLAKYAYDSISNLYLSLSSWRRRLPGEWDEWRWIKGGSKRVEN